MRLSTGTNEWNHSYFTGNSLSALHSLQQLHDDTVSTSVHPLVSTQETNGTTSSGSALGPQLLHGHISSPVLAGPTCNVTGEAMPTSLAEAVTQLSFREFLQRCNLLIAPLQPPQLPVPISPLDAAVQTTPPTDASQDVSTQTSDQPVYSLSFDVAVQTSFHSVHTSSLDALVQTIPHSTVSQDVSTQMGARPASSFSLDAAVQTPTRSTVSHDTSTQLPPTEFFIGCIFSSYPFDRQGSSSAQGDIGSASPPLPDIATTCSLSSSSLDRDDHVRTLAPRVLLQPPPGLEQYAPPPGLDIDAHLCASHGKPVKAAPLRPRLCSAMSVTPPQPPACTIHVGTHPVRSATTGKRSASTALAGTHNPVDTDPRAGTGPFPKPRALVLLLVHFGQSKPDGHSGLDTADSDLMHHQFRLSLLQWNPGPARRNPTNIVSAACGKFHAVILQEDSDHVPHISDQFLAYTGNTDLAILLNKDTFEPDPTVLTFKADSTSKGTWGMVLLIVRGLLRRPSLSGSPTVTFCSVHIQNVVAKKRDASSELLQRLHGCMREHNVDFIGGDFNMSAFSTVGDVFTDDEFSAPGNSLLWGLGALEEPNRECARFLIMPKRPYEWRVHSHGCYKFDNDILGLGPRDQSAHLPVFLHLRNTNLPGPSSVMRSEQA